MTLAQYDDETLVLLAQVVNISPFERVVGTPDQPFLLNCMPGGDSEDSIVIASLRVKASRAVEKEVLNPRTRVTEGGVRSGW